MEEDRREMQQRNLVRDALRRMDDKMLKREFGVSLERLKLLQKREQKRVLDGGLSDEELK
jgi:hypothetical protein